MLAITQRAERRQTQTVSHRLQLAVRLLQMSSLEFSATVQDLMGRNPFLETPEGDEEDAEESSLADEGAEGGIADLLDRTDGEAPEPAHGDDREIWSAENRGGMNSSDDGQVDLSERTACQIGLREHLLGQLRLLRLPERDRILACIIAESVDDDGYLRQSLEDLSTVSGMHPDPDEISIALRRVQALEPAGVAARDVAECLRLQLGNIVCERSRELARRVVDEHLTLLAKRDVARLARELQITTAEAESVVTSLRKLDPRPGLRFESSQVHYVVPDVIAYKASGRWQVKLNPAVVPKIRLNHSCAQLFRQHKGAEHREMARHLSEAGWAVQNIERRFSTIMAVASAIVRRQHHFLDFGAMAMKPLALQEIADELGLHESTVSRVTNNKFLSTPTGVFELKYFFSRAMVTQSGNAFSGTAIRGLIKDLIEAETEKKPFSDVEITRQLAVQGLVVARRTVTKYRQMLKIEPVDRRRRSDLA